MRSVSAITCLWLVIMSSPVPAQPLTFDGDVVGSSPKGWILTMTGKGSPKWSVDRENPPSRWVCRGAVQTHSWVRGSGGWACLASERRQQLLRRPRQCARKQRRALQDSRRRAQLAGPGRTEGWIWCKSCRSLQSMAHPAGCVRRSSVQRHLQRQTLVRRRGRSPIQAWLDCGPRPTALPHSPTSSTARRSRAHRSDQPLCIAFAVRDFRRRASSVASVSIQSRNVITLSSLAAIFGHTIQ